MKILTFQHKNILNDINKNGVYIAKINSNYKKNTPICYDIVFNSIPVKEANSTQPIFGWHSVFKNEDITVNTKTINRCLEMVPFDRKNYLLFELEIDEKNVSLQDFYNFVDARCEEEGFDAYFDTFEEFPVNILFEITNYEIQATFTAIKKENIVNIYSIDENNIRLISN